MSPLHNNGNEMLTISYKPQIELYGLNLFLSETVVNILIKYFENKVMDTTLLLLLYQGPWEPACNKSCHKTDHWLILQLPVLKLIFHTFLVTNSCSL